MTASITDPIEVTLRDGGRVTIRPIRRDDVAYVATAPGPNGERQIGDSERPDPDDIHQVIYSLQP
jgi:hypothetical protein